MVILFGRNNYRIQLMLIIQVIFYSFKAPIQGFYYLVRAFSKQFSKIKYTKNEAVSKRRPHFIAQANIIKDYIVLALLPSYQYFQPAKQLCDNNRHHHPLPQYQVLEKPFQITKLPLIVQRFSLILLFFDNKFVCHYLL